MLLVILLFAMFASLFGLSKDTLNYSEPFFLIGSRMTFAGLVLLLNQHLFNRQAFYFKVTHLKIIFLLGFFNIYLTNVAEIWGIQHMISSKACLIYSISPFLTAIIAYFALKETLSLKKCVGLCIGFIGLVPIFMTQSTTTQFIGELSWISLPDMALLVAVFCSVCGWTLLKKVVNDYQYTPLMANGISMTLGGSLALLHSYLSGENWSPIPVTFIFPFIRNTIIMCVISNFICYNLYGYLLKRYSATFMSFAGLVTPFFASFFGWYFLEETITWHYAVSVVIFSIGLTIFYQEELKQEKFCINNATKVRY